jgi:hypothetical protein
MSDDPYDNPMEVRVDPESRTLFIPEEKRVLTVVSEDRTDRVPVEER